MKETAPYGSGPGVPWCRAPVAIRYGAALALVLMSAVSHPISAQEPGVRLSGVVFDSTAMGPLPEALVVVLGTSVRAYSDEGGRFELSGVPTGAHDVTFYHRRLQELGAGALIRQVEVNGTGGEPLTLAVPSRNTLTAGWCAADGVPPGGAALAGVVTDSLTGVPIPGASVEITPLERTGRQRRPLTVKTDDAGRYRICSVPAGETLKVQARFGPSPGRSVEVTIPSGGAEVQDLAMLMTGEGLLSGQVLDHALGTPVVGAEVSVLGTDARVLSGNDGRFVLDGLPPGRHLVNTSYLGYAPRTDSVTVFSLETVGIEVRMAVEAVEVEGLVVTTRSRPGERRASLATDARADAITMVEIEPLLTRVASVGQLLRLMNVPGLNVRNVRVMEANGAIFDGLCVEVSRRAGGDQCYPALVALDGVPQQNADQVLQDLSAEIVERIEVLSPSDAAFQFGTLGANGAIMIFTRR